MKFHKAYFLSVFNIVLIHLTLFYKSIKQPIRGIRKYGERWRKVSTSSRILKTGWSRLDKLNVR